MLDTTCFLLLVIFSRFILCLQSLSLVSVFYQCDCYKVYKFLYLLYTSKNIFLYLLFFPGFILKIFTCHIIDYTLCVKEPNFLLNYDYFFSNHLNFYLVIFDRFCFGSLKTVCTVPLSYPIFYEKVVFHNLVDQEIYVVLGTKYKT